MTATVIDLYGVPLPMLEPGSPEWLRCISASKVAAILGLSRYESRFSLYHRMQGTIGPEPDDDLKRRGHYLEPAIRAWFADQHPEWTTETCGSFRHPDRDWQTASPDGLVYGPDFVAGLECKSDADHADEWGAPGTDQVPPAVRAQVMWQMDTTGTRRTHVAMISAYLEFREYVVDYDPDDAALILERCTEFRAELAGGIPPPIDGHTQTYVVVRELHPGIDDETVELPWDVANGYRDALAAAKEATAAKQLVTNLVADLMGDARKAVDLDGRLVALRIPGRGDNPPFLRPAPATRSTP